MQIPSARFDHRAFLATLPQQAGVYRMLNCDACVIYIGKAKNLKQRISHYFNNSAQHIPKIRSLVAQIAKIEITVTHTETEALLLEHQLIKKYLPRYNVLLRDDKSYPFIHLSDHDTFPRISLHRGVKKQKGQYFGPYPHSQAVHTTLNTLQKIFAIRQCDESFFRHRSRPCLQYQIKRCCAPCVGLVTPEDYAERIQHSLLFLQGKSSQVIEILAEKMQAAAKNLAFEKAAYYRDHISQLQTVQSQQSMHTGDNDNTDIIACLTDDKISCIAVVSIRHGQNLGTRSYFPQHTEGETSAHVLYAFLSQYYLQSQHDIPSQLIIYPALTDNEKNTISQAIKQHSQQNCHISSQVRGVRTRWLSMAKENAQISLAQRRPNRYRERLIELSIVLNLPELPQRLECFDISHALGEATVASCVVFGQHGIIKKAYRRFSIENTQQGDDCAAMEQALQRRFKDHTTLPDILFIDGATAQVKVAQIVLEEYALTSIRIIGVAKGEGRKAGLEQLILANEERPLILDKTSPALHLIQYIRDESHRFALQAHRTQRLKIRKTSILEHIDGIGVKRRQHLLTHFGGLQGLKNAGVDDLARVKGISKSLAEKIYNFFRTRE